MAFSDLGSSHWSAETTMTDSMCSYWPAISIMLIGRLVYRRAVLSQGTLSHCACVEKLVWGLSWISWTSVELRTNPHGKDTYNTAD